MKRLGCAKDAVSRSRTNGDSPFRPQRDASSALDQARRAASEARDFSSKCRSPAGPKARTSRRRVRTWRKRARSAIPVEETRRRPGTYFARLRGGGGDLDESDVFEVLPATDEQREQATAAGWPDGLLDRILALRWPQWRVDLYLSFRGFPNPEMIDAEVRDRERLADGLSAREATWEDDERLSDLFANASERIGDWDVIVERSPNPYAQQRMQENAHVKILTERGVALGVNAYSGRSSIVDGQRLSVGWMGGWRIRNGFRRLGYSNLLMNAPGSSANVFGMVTYWYVRVDNETAKSWIASRVTELQDDRGAGRAVAKLTATVHHFAPSENARRDPRVRRIAPADIDRCVELINRTHSGLDLFRPYSAAFLEGRLDDLFWGPKPPFVPTVYGWDDMVVLVDNDEVVACCGQWDRGRDVRERWRHRDTGEERLVDATYVLDMGYAEGREDALAALLGHLLVRTAELGRATQVVALEFLPDVLSSITWAVPESETRSLETMGFNSPEVRIDAKINRPYTDLGYW